MPRLASARVVAFVQRETASQFYGDTATLITRTASTPDTFGQVTISTASTSLACNFTDKPAAERWTELADIGQIDGEVRFASTTAPAKGDYITVTGRFDNSAYTDRTFEIIGIRNRGALGYVCALRAVVL
jgi:hypothetical protein